MLQFGDVVLLEFPFTNLKDHKQRPAIVIKDTRDDDAVFIRVTSKTRPDQFELKITEWDKVGLLKPSVIRVHKIATLQTSLIVKKLGKLNKQDKFHLKNTIKLFFETTE